MIRSKEREVTHEGISPEIDFQSATTRVVRLPRLQISGEIFPVINPELRRRFCKFLSDGSPRRGSVRAALKAKSAARSDGGQGVTA
ncbi:hypothetical protein Lal_00029088 [Lupinus albus]|nr:hypothetical protein Lal_00029088 [Lupinus albus]